MDASLLFSAWCGALLSASVYTWTRDGAEIRKKIRLAKDATTRSCLEAKLNKAYQTAVESAIMVTAGLIIALTILLMHALFSLKQSWFVLVNASALLIHVLTVLGLRLIYDRSVKP